MTPGKIMSDILKRYMLFSLREQRYAIDVDAVAEISEVLPEFPIPNAPHFLRGVVNIHGKVAAVLDLGLYIGAGPTLKGRNLLLLNSAGSSLAILVEQMERMVGGDEILSREPGKGTFATAALILADGPAMLLAVDALLESVEKAL